MAARGGSLPIVPVQLRLAAVHALCHRTYGRHFRCVNRSFTNQLKLASRHLFCEMLAEALAASLLQKMFVTPKIETAVMLENNPGAKLVEFGVRQADDK